MKTHLETERLLIRELEGEDINDWFEMDSDPAVHEFLDQKPIQSKEEIENVLEMIQQQYQKNGIGRWAVTDKQTGEMLGWCGLKYFTEPVNNHIHIYEHSYRFKQKHWGKGYATESSEAILEWGFKNLPIDTIYAITHPENEGSMNVLKKVGFEFKEYFYFDYIDNENCTWFELKKENFSKNK